MRIVTEKLLRKIHKIYSSDTKILIQFMIYMIIYCCTKIDALLGSGPYSTPPGASASLKKSSRERWLVSGESTASESR